MPEGHLQQLPILHTCEREEKKDLLSSVLKRPKTQTGYSICESRLDLL